MIIDVIQNYKLYYGLSERMNFALEFTAKTDFSVVEPGKYIIDNDNIFYIVNNYSTKNINECSLEAHRKYIDIQYMADGFELIGYSPIINHTAITGYDESKDIIFYKGESSMLNFNKGMFSVFFPGELHMPGTGKSSLSVKKVVVKVRV